MIPLRGVGIYMIAVLSVICPYTFVNNIYILFCNMLFSFWYKSTTEGKKVYHKQKITVITVIGNNCLLCIILAFIIVKCKAMWNFFLKSMHLFSLFNQSLAVQAGFVHWQSNSCSIGSRELLN